EADHADREAAQDSIIDDIEDSLAGVPNLDLDKVFRNFRAVLRAMLRTNFYRLYAPHAASLEEDAYPDPAAEPPVALAFKLDPRQLAFVPEPRPYREIFVFSPRVEGIHLRGGEIARGGLRWSDRAQDYRTEVLGLAKAQQVKNTVIIPAGAKGGFVPKKLPVGGSRDEIFQEGRASYRVFVSSLLDITDNIVAGATVPPADIVRQDSDDPYLVVAADKGTATFSDTANAIAQDRNFWLGDAFASGGSAGYDHKAMGITARGAWEAVKRHFREENH
ncbi:MAG: NAD-glutamate dehydrogenase domain-containing protein, partial [Pseudomonadota bacterium]